MTTSTDQELIDRLRNQVVNGLPHSCLPDLERLCDRYEALRRESDSWQQLRGEAHEEVLRLTNVAADEPRESFGDILRRAVNEVLEYHLGDDLQGDEAVSETVEDCLDAMVDVHTQLVTGRGRFVTTGCTCPRDDEGNPSGYGGDHYPTCKLAALVKHDNNVRYETCRTAANDLAHAVNQFIQGEDNILDLREALGYFRALEAGDFYSGPDEERSTR